MGFAYDIFRILYGNDVSAIKLKWDDTADKTEWIKTNAEIGDYIRFGGHSGIVVGKDSECLRLYEANGYYTNQSTYPNKVTIRANRTWNSITTKMANKTDLYIWRYRGSGNSYEHEYRITASDFLSIRQSDSTSATKLGQINPNETTIVTKYNDDNSWGYTTYNGITGWICLTDYAAFVKDSSESSTEIMSDGSLYLCTDEEGHAIRASASTSGDLLGTIPDGEYFVVTETTADGLWGYLTYGNVSGWTRLYAAYTQYVESYTCPVVTFNANGGSVSTSSKKVYINTPYGTLPTPTRTGYTFNGWYTAASGGTKITSTTNVSLTANQTLYAHWTANPYTVTYDANGGSGAPAAQIKTHGVTLTLSSTKPTRTGYMFAGWATSANGSVAYAAGASYTTNASITLYAVWNKNSCSILFDENGDNVTIDETRIVVNCGEAYGTLPTPIRPGYTFDGWYTEITGGTKVTSSSIVPSSSFQWLYAHWTANPYTVTYDANGGSGAPASQTKTHGVTLTLSTTKPTRTGYTFAGWATSASGSAAYAAGASYSTNASATLYAAWTADT
ncbi:MAG: InlB B-repeat-containing protein, partial [Clostridia bacterium]|nr:InlB B-repeat-containing protein [Clostridia bacterium]